MARLVKWLLVGSMVFMFLLFLLVVALAFSGPMVKSDSILHVTLDGELHESPESDLFAALSSDSDMTLRSLTESIRRAAADDRIVGLLLQVKDPMIGLAQLQEIEDAVAEFRATDKWTAAHIETAGEFSRGDGTYALAVCAENVFLSPPGDVNLVGLRAEVPFVKGLLEKLKITAHFDKRHEYKNAVNMFTHTAMSKAHREAIVSLVDDLQQTLLEHIAARRRVTIDVTRDWVATGPHLGSAALSAGLVDRLAYWDEVLAEAQNVAGRDDSLLELEAYSTSGELHDEGPTVALIYGAGQVIRGESSGGGSPTMGSDTVTEAFREARDKEVEGVLFRVDSPGGSYVASDLIRREVEVTRDAGIPVVVSMGNVAASGGYFVAMNADRVVAQSGTITGSIGVFVGTLSLRKFWEHWLGITFDEYQSAPHAAFFSSLDLPNDETKTRIGAFLDRIYDDFVDKAAAGRGMPRDELEPLARGRVWSGRAAKANGLIDEIGGMEKSLDLLKEVMGVDADQNVTLEIFPTPKSTFDLIGEQFGAAARMVHLLESGQQLLRQMRGGGSVLLLPVEPGL